MMSAILFVLWVLGLVSGALVGQWVHLLLAAAAVALVLAGVSEGRRALP